MPAKAKAKAKVPSGKTLKAQRLIDPAPTPTPKRKGGRPPTPPGTGRKAPLIQPKQVRPNKFPGGGGSVAWDVEYPPEKIKRFVDIYLTNGFRVGDAAEDVGYSERTAYQTGYRLLQDPRVKALLELRKEDYAKRFTMTQERVVEELTRMATGDVRSLYDPATGRIKEPHDLSDTEASMVAGWEPTKFGRKAKAYDRIRALELIDRITARMSAPAEAPGTPGIVINFNGGVEE